MLKFCVHHAKGWLLAVEPMLQDSERYITVGICDEGVVKRAPKVTGDADLKEINNLKVILRSYSGGFFKTTRLADRGLVHNPFRTVIYAYDLDDSAHIEV